MSSYRLRVVRVRRVVQDAFVTIEADDIETARELAYESDEAVIRWRTQEESTEDFHTDDLYEALPGEERTKMMTESRKAELIQRYAYPGATLADAEKAASGYMLVTDESQPVDEETLASDIDEMRAELGIR